MSVREIEFSVDSFRQDLHAIHARSASLGDRWELKQAPYDSDQVYLERVEQRLVDTEILTITCHVIFSEAFSVPVLYLNVHKSNGKSFNYDELYAHFNLKRDEDGSQMILSQQEHPLLFTPFYFVHPCRTLDWMRASRCDDVTPRNPTLKWLSFVLASFNIPLDLRYALNEPILSEQNLKYWYTIHTSLDVVEEKLRKTDFKDLYLGLLYLIEDYRIYGYVTNSKIKFLIVVETSNQHFHDAEIKTMFKKLHASYVNTVCNPFYEIGEPIQSKKFDELVKSLILKVSAPVVQTTLLSPLSSTIINPATVSTTPNPLISSSQSSLSIGSSVQTI